jgi:hypothetical protein
MAQHSPQPNASDAAQSDAAPEAPAAVAVDAVELMERRRFNRPIPAAQVIECNEDEAWALWSQWSSL